MSESTTATVERCPACRHAPHAKPCLNLASDNDCSCPGGFSSETVKVWAGPTYAPADTTEAGR